jgi:N-acetylneuraminic acid mutarotase
VWLFGGYGFDANGAVSYLNDLWELNPSTNEWTWVSGSSTIGTTCVETGGTSYCGQPGVYGKLKTPASGNVPGGRAVPSSWIDDNGNLWLFGGYGFDMNENLSTLNDVWEFSPSSKEWTWMGGSSTIGSDYGQSGVYGTLKTPASGNIPGSRYFSTDWTDSSGNFWLFGGYGFSGNGDYGYLNDLWEFNPSTNEWTWEGGGKTIAGDGTGSPGVYGTPKTPAPGNMPGGRGYSTSWIDASDNVWLFGGGGFDADGNSGYLNDLWELNPSTNEWTWMGGSNTVVGNSGQPGVYGMLGTPAAGNTPGGRETAIAWSGGGNSLWLFGGSGYDANDTFGSLGDLWEFSPSIDEWTWMGGSSTPGNSGQKGVYGTPKEPSAGNFPGSRYYVSNWTDSSGDFWLFGGIGLDSNNTGGYLNDLWKFQPASFMTSPTPGSLLTGTTATFAWSAGAAGSQYDLHLSAVAPGGYDLYSSGHVTRLSATVNGLPTNGGKIYARLYSFMSGATLYTDYTYTATSSLARLISPVPNSTLASNSVKFTWSAGTAGAQYDLHLSAVAPGGYDIYTSGHIAGLSTTVSRLPTSGGMIYARLYTILNGVLLYNDYTYTATSIAKLISPSPNSTLTATRVAFSWSTGTAGSQYDLHLSAVAPGGYDLYSSGHMAATSVTVNNLPNNGEPIYARLYTIRNGVTLYNDYIYTAF